jgi:hypothetical protein
MKRLWRRFLWRIGWLKLDHARAEFPILEEIELLGGPINMPIWMYVRQGVNSVIFPTVRGANGLFGQIEYRDTGRRIPTGKRRIFAMTSKSLEAIESMHELRDLKAFPWAIKFN